MLKLKSPVKKTETGVSNKIVNKPLKMSFGSSKEVDQSYKIDQMKNPYIEEAKRMSLVRLVDIWKIAFERLKDRRLLGDDLLRYKAVKSILTFKHRVELPKDGK